jgi:UDP-N-acetylmuramoylalanine--D-glutamate ligase
MTGSEHKGVFDSIVVGLGLTGLSCARYLAARGERIAVADTRSEPPQLAALREMLPAVPVYLGDLAAAPLTNAGRLVVSPGLSAREPAIAEAARSGVAILGDIELFCQAARAPIVAVTGANGKSTVTTLVAEMARVAGQRVAAGGNLAPAALDLLDEPQPDLYVLELSSFQLETTYSLDAAAAVVLNITADHMDRYASLAEYQAAKARIYYGHGVMVINLDDPLVAALQYPGRETLIFTLGDPGLQKNVFGVRDGWLVQGGQQLLPVSEVRLPGAHNLANALAALALGTAVDLPLVAMLEALRRFAGLPHRCQWIARKAGADWYDDSKGTNVGASIAAIRGLAGDNDVILIAGGDGKGADFTELAAVAPGGVRAAVLLGRDAPKLAAVLKDIVPVTEVADMPAAVAAAAGRARPGDKVLLSPACASLDMFRDYKHRGELFAAAVRELP